MSSAAQDQARIQALDQAGLIAAWEDIQADAVPPAWASGKAFEYLVIRAFKLEGLRVRWPFGVTFPRKFGTLEQLDGLAYLDGRAFVVESKDYVDPIGIEAIAKLRFRLESRPPGIMGIVFSASGFSTAAEVFAQFLVPLNVLLWSEEDLNIALRSGCMVNRLRMKLEYAIEEGLPLFALEGP